MKLARAASALPALLLLGGCGGGDAPAPAAPETAALISVQAETAAPETITDSLAMAGTVAARAEVVVAAKILSYIRTIAVDEGDRVRAGQLLVVMDDQELRAGVDAAHAAKAETESAILAAEHGIAAAESKAHLAELTHKRYLELRAKDSVSEQEFDEVDANLRAARAALALARATKSQAEASRSRADAAIARSETMLGDAEVKSPAAGVVTKRLVDPGALASPGAGLLRIEQAGGYRLEVAVPESHLTRLAVGREVGVEIDALGSDGPSRGRIAEIVPAVDRSSRTFTVKVALPASAALRSGLYGRVFLAGDSRQALTVSAGAVVRRGQLRFVLVAQDGRARRRAVTLSESAGARYEVLSGLAAGEQIILDPTGISDGQPVEVSAGIAGRPAS